MEHESIAKGRSVRIEMAGRKFGRLMVLEPNGYTPSGAMLWRCACDCGVERTVSGKYLRNGLTRSCGCLKAEVLRDASVTHGMAGTGTYASWSAMLSRCTNENQESYKSYGALGVTVCERWASSFENFLADMGPRPEGKTLDRSNPFGNYEPSNCEWQDAKHQAANRRGAVAIQILQKLKASGKYPELDALVGI